MITINPASATSDDIIEIVFIDDGCPNSIVETRIGDDFHVTVEVSGVCQFLPPPQFSHTWVIGRESPGDYTAP